MAPVWLLLDVSLFLLIPITHMHLYEMYLIKLSSVALPRDLPFHAWSRKASLTFGLNSKESAKVISGHKVPK